MIKKLLFINIGLWLLISSSIYANEQLKITSITQQPNEIQFKLVTIKDNRPVTLNDLKEVHTQKIHGLIIDDTLQAYSHVHPQAAGKLGLYKFQWHPKKAGNYRLWVDVTPVQNQHQEYVMVDLITHSKEKSTIDKTVSLKSTVDGFTFVLSFDTSKLIVGKASMGTIRITDQQGKSVKNLKPLMGAFAHIVGFEDDFKTIAHMHPMGSEPSHSSDRGGPEVQFHFKPEKAGFIKLFVQVQIDGKEIFAPFGVWVSSTSTTA